MRVALKCLERLRPRWEAGGVRLLPYQVEAAERVLAMGGQGILADEVGLGKTIEAGLVMSELMERGEGDAVLVLSPASLCRQWQRELAEKFGLAFRLATSAADVAGTPRAICSLDLAKRPEAKAALAARPWDLVVVDEAHRLKNRQTQSHRLVAGLQRQRLLLLSATPMQNDLTELYALVSLVQPRLFGSFQAFWRQFLLDRRTPRDPVALKRLLASVMVRHHRQELGEDERLPPRHVTLLPLRLTAQERRLYDGVSAAVRAEYWRRVQGDLVVLPLITLQREVCSSAAAVRRTLEGMDRSAWLGDDLDALRALAAEVREQTKAHVLRGLVADLQDRAIVFTEFRATQGFLAEVLADAGMPVWLFHGEMDAAARDQALRRFVAEPRAVLVATESGGEGLNLQVCRNIVNYDLPWNPMRVEQRIGRVHRVGQRRDVYVYNLYAEDTVEEHLLRLLDEKINLFRQVVGELDVILRRLESGGRRSLEGRIAEILWQSRDGRELGHRFEELGRQLLWYRRRAREQDALLAASAPAVPGGAAGPGA
jgi:SNF2 family DNA or RNA helicase